MNKKLMALAVAGALAPAAALAQNYSIYGRLTLGVDSYEAKGAETFNTTNGTVTANPAGDYDKRARVFDNGSRVGFRGTEDLGGGVQAVFLIETGVSVDNGSNTGQGGQANSSAGLWGSRVGHVGLSGSLGLVTWGRSNVFWTNGTIDQVGANWVNAASQTNTGIFGRGMGVGVSRVSNTMQYTSPVWGGFNFVASFSPSRAEAQGAATNTDGQLIALTLQGTHGPFAWGYDFVQDSSNTPAGTNAPKQGVNAGGKLRLAYKYVPAGQIALLSVATLIQNGGAGLAGGSATGLPAACNTTASQTAAGGDCEFKQSSVGISWDHMFGPFHPIIQFNKVGKISGSGCTGFVCDQTEATQMVVAMRYIFSKRTHAYVNYTKIDNDSNYNLDFNGASMTSRNGAANQFTGADPTLIGAGVIHNF